MAQAWRMGRFNAQRWIGATFLGLAAVAALAGCGATTAQREDASIVTQSDETDVQRRARIRLELAANYFQSGKTTIALDEIKQVLVLDPNSGDAYNMRGLIYMQLGEPDIASESFNRAQSLKPNDADIMHNSAIINLNVLHEMTFKKIPKIFYSSSACIYPERNQLHADRPVLSEASAYPADPDSEYGWEKLFNDYIST